MGPKPTVRTQVGPELTAEVGPKQPALNTEGAGGTVRAAMHAVAHTGLVEQIEDTDQLLIGVRDRMRANGYPLPALPAELAYLRDKTAAPQPSDSPGDSEGRR